MSNDQRNRGGLSQYKYMLLYKKEDVVLLPMRQLSTKDQNDTDINNYRSF